MYSISKKAIDFILGVSKIYSRTITNNTKWVLNQKFILFHSHILDVIWLNFLATNFKGKRTKKNISNIRKILWKLYQFNVWSA